ncbi:MAG: hydrogenase maturation nickel metallochaperone HypA [Woeseiaceae bacterium]
MHELSVCQAIIGEVQALAAARGAEIVSDIHLRVGPLSGVESPLLRNAFPFASAGTVAANAELHISDMPVRVRCRLCAEESETPPNRLLCGSCSSWQTELLSGDELLLERVEMRCTAEEVGTDV